ncbi:MAG: hypothetical protein ACJAXH_001644 [Colwellia sp.]|jgi:hypothetical protein
MLDKVLAKRKHRAYLSKWVFPMTLTQTLAKISYQLRHDFRNNTSTNSTTTFTDSEA